MTTTKIKNYADVIAEAEAKVDVRMKADGISRAEASKRTYRESPQLREEYIAAMAQRETDRKCSCR